jgi:tetratricopeptide (TPR) repeat protein
MKYLNCFLMLLFFQSLNGQKINESKIDALKIDFQNGDFQNVIDESSIIFDKDTNNFEALSLLAQAQYASAKYTNAKKYFHVLENKRHDSINVFIALMKIYEIELNYPLAVKYATKLSKIKNKQPYYTRKLADYFIASGYTYEGIKIMKEAYKIDSNDVQSIIAYGELCYKNNLVEITDTITARALTFEPNNLALRALSAKSVLRLKDFKKAIIHLEFIREKSVLSSFQNRSLGYAYLKIDSINKAILYLETSIRKGENMEYNYYYLGMAYYKAGKVQQSKEAYKMAMKEAVSENISSYYQDLASIYAEEKNHSEAIQLMNDANRIYEDVESLFYEALYTDQKGESNHKKSISLYEKYINDCGEKCKNKSTAETRLKYLKSLKFKR